jgi:predicted ATPase/class 3 adenylate cyclase
VLTCPVCGFENLAEMRFCGNCGTRLGLVCDACGFVNPRHHRFCGYCGTRLAEAATVGAAPADFAPESVPAAASLPGQARAAEPVHLAGERRLATVLLADVCSSTKILEQIGTESWVQTMNRVLQLLEAEVYRYGGVVDQFRGDGLVAFFGATAAHEDDPERAILAGLAIHKVVAALAAELRQAYDFALKLRVGINTGEIIVASIGDDRHHAEDTAMGEAIALAARMEAAAEAETVLVSENTYHLVTSRFDWQSLGEIAVRGLSQPVAVYRPLAPRPGAVRERRLPSEEPLTVVIGREMEFDRLKDEVERLRAGRGSIFLLSGETGMGKSSLIAGVRQHTLRADALLAKAGGFEQPWGTAPPRTLTWLLGRCRSYSQSSPYSMWLDLLESWLGVGEEEPAEQTRDRLCQKAEELWGTDLDEHYPYLASLLSLPLEEHRLERVRHLDGEGRRQQYFLALRHWIEGLAKERPVVIALEDLHWSDTTSLQLLDYCLPVCEQAPVLWLLAFREERTSPVWAFRQQVETEYPHRLTALALAPLRQDQAKRMIDQLIGPHVLSHETRALILEKSEGNPYYIEEFIHALMREGVLIKDDLTGEWRATREVDSLDLPDSLHNLLLARIDRLSPEERHVLQMAAVIGSVFWSEVLEGLVCDGRQNGAGLKSQLTALQRHQLIQERRQAPGLGHEYVFGSNLIRDAAYEGLLSVQRVTCHRQVADTLEQIFGEKVLARYYSLLAYHYRQAGSVRKELFYTLLAADEARSLYANAEALKHYARALELLDQIEAHSTEERQRYALRTQRFEVLDGRREVHYLMGNYEAGWRDAEALLPLADRLEDDPVWRIDALLQQPGVGFSRSQGEARAGVPLAEEALRLARQVGDRHREMRCLGAIAGQRYMLNDPTWQATGEQALQMARELGDKRFEVGILTGVGSVYALSEPERSQEYLETALSILETLDDKMAELELLSAVGMRLESSVDYYRRLEECHAKEIQVSREIGHRPAESRALMFYGQIQSLYLGDYEGGLPLLEKSREMWEGTSDEVFPLLRIAQVRIEQRRFPEAELLLERTQRVDEKLLHDLGRVGSRLLWAMLYNAIGEEPGLREVLAFASQTFQMTAENPSLSQQYKMVAACEAAGAHLKLAQIVAGDEARQAHRRQALDSSQTALDIYRAMGFVQPIECVSEEIFYRHSLALRINERISEADQFLRRAYDEMMKKHELIPSDSRYRQTFLDNISLHRQIRSAAAPLL